MRISKKKQPLEANLVMYDLSLDIPSEFKDFGLLVSHNPSEFPRQSHSFQSEQNVGFNLAYMQRSI